MKTRLLSGFLAVVGGGATIVGCFEPTSKVSAEAPRVVTTPAPTTPIPTSPLAPQSVSSSQSSAPAVEAVPATLSPGITEVAKLYQSNVGEEILLAYINNYGPAFNATADEILYLNDLGVSDNVVTAVIKHQGNPNAQAVAVAQPEPQPEPAPAPAPAATAPLVPQESVAQPAPVTVNQFYDTLSPYGSWVETDYGRCWRPAVIVSNPGWRPYCDRGHWIYTDSGWYWASDYSWGWATFHYGRWCTDTRFGWVWLPDTTWGASWVSWRYTADHCGWAPLPPAAHFRAGVGFTFHSANVGVSFDFGLTDSCYTFVPLNRFCDPHPYRYCAPRESVRVIYNRSTVINNYIVHNNTTIINEGVGRQRIEVATKQPVQKVAIHEWPKNTTAISNPDRVHHVGNDLVVYKPAAPSLVKPHYTPAPTQNSGSTSAWGEKNQPHGRGSSSANPTAWNGNASTPASARTQEVTPNASNTQPKHRTSKATEAKDNSFSSPRVTTVTPQAQTPSVATPSHGNPNRQGGRDQVESPRARTATVPQAEAPLIPQSPARSNPRHDGDSIARDNNRFESPRQSSPAVSTPAPAPRVAPSASSEGRSQRGQSWGQGGRAASQGSPRSESGGKLAERERDSGPGNGNGRGRP